MRRILSVNLRTQGFTAFFATILLLLGLPNDASAMHLSEGILPLPWALLWFAVAAPFLALSVKKLKEKSNEAPAFKAFLGMVGAAVFLVSAMPIPVPVAGSSSHPAGTGMAAILVGPYMSVLVASIALTMQALFMAHGGLTTWGADVASMGIVGSFAGYYSFIAMRRSGFPLMAAAFAAGLVGDWATYATTSFQLASALHGAVPLGKVFITLALAFAPTQVPLGVLEGFMSWGALSFLLKRRPDILSSLGVMKEFSALSFKGVKE